MRTADPTTDEVERFLREATIQARLDHPAIVPVHELGHDAEGRPYFTMKRLAGVTLWDEIEAKRPIQPLLRAFAEVCLAIEFAHACWVISARLGRRARRGRAGRDPQIRRCPDRRRDVTIIGEIKLPR